MWRYSVVEGHQTGEYVGLCAGSGGIVLRILGSSCYPNFYRGHKRIGSDTLSAMALNLKRMVSAILLTSLTLKIRAKSIHFQLGFLFCQQLPYLTLSTFVLNNKRVPAYCLDTTNMLFQPISFC